MNRVMAWGNIGYNIFVGLLFWMGISLLPALAGEDNTDKTSLPGGQYHSELMPTVKPQDATPGYQTSKGDPEPITAENGEINSASTHVPKNEITLDCGDGVMMKFVRIPRGTFMLDLPENGEKWALDEIKLQWKLPSFYLGVYEVTQAQYEAVMGTNPSNFKGRNLPVERVNCDEAIEFCRKLSAKTGRKARLPTELEWEYACQAGATMPFNAISKGQANFIENRNGNCWVYIGTQEVGCYAANAWGLYDMHGNVWEWCAGGYRDYYENVKTDPQEASEIRVRSLHGTYRIDCAGNYRSPLRVLYIPGLGRDLRGFRVALDM